MIIIKKKHILQELAVSLFLTLEFNPDTTAASIINRIRERGKDALAAAEAYTGALGEREIQAFLTSKHRRFSIDCGKDIVKGDIIRFTEQVYDNRIRPPRPLGNRGIIAEVTAVGTMRGQPMLDMRVINCGGTWDIAPETHIRRTLRIVTRMDVMRAPWEFESQRHQSKDDQEQKQHTVKIASSQILKRAGQLKSK